MRSRLLLFLLAAFGALIAAYYSTSASLKEGAGFYSDCRERLTDCDPPGEPLTGMEAVKSPGESKTAFSGLSDCPVTQPPEPAFVPPEPWPAQPPGANRFWYGDSGLWTALPADGAWNQLALGEKFWWWSEKFDVSVDTTPDLTVIARRLDGDAPVFQESRATNGFHESFNWAMLMGVNLPSPGCWAFTGEYKGDQLTFILWVPAE